MDDVEGQDPGADDGRMEDEWEVNDGILTGVGGRWGDGTSTGTHHPL